MLICQAQRGEPLPLGHRWEHLARRIVFDISPWVEAFGPGTVRLLHQRQEDTAPYPVPVTRTDADGTENDTAGTLVLWDVTNTDTDRKCAYGRAELRYYAGAEGTEEFLVKSDIYRTSVLDALGASLAEAPEAQQNWLDTLLEASEKIDGVNDAVKRAEDAANTAYAAVIAAQSAQEQAEAAREAVENPLTAASHEDRGAAYQELQNAIISLGGNVS